MDLNEIPLFRALGERMAWLTRRQEVLAQNIANADTPGYVPRDLEELDFDSLVRSGPKRLAAASTSDGHFGFASGSVGRFRDGVDKASAQVQPGGNGVVIEKELMKAAHTASDYQVATNLYKKHVNMIKTVLGTGGR